MNDDPTPLTDEELSAAVDGEADAALLARIEADPTARARRDELRAAADQVAALPPVELGAADVDRLIATALDAPTAPAAPARAVARTTWLVAAAVIVLVAIGLGLVLSGRDAGDDVASSDGIESSQATEAFDAVGGSTEDGAATAELAPDAADSEAPASTTTAPGGDEASAALVDLGTFASGAELREALASSFPATANTTRTDSTAGALPAPAAVDHCATQLQVTLELDGDPLQVGVATVDG
ncbi:MAG: hypothetical protein KDA98_16730, partial [Acidimicrobiales bacterium]|nr:hypothetical protein [Acidimicrobiales bacterium]